MESKVVIKRYFKILQRSEESEEEYERLVTGVVADPVTVDSYGYKIPKEVVRKMALTFMERFGNMGVRHQKDEDGNPIALNDKIRVVENWVTREEGTINGELVVEGSWVMTCRILDDEIWQDVLDGELNGFSFEAIIAKVPVQEGEG